MFKLNSFILKTGVLCFFISLLISPAFCDETLALTTYYPSPHGVYKSLTLFPSDDFDPIGACTNEGEMYYDDSDDKIYVCDGIVWQPLSGYWTLAGINLHPNDMNWNVGIGVIGWGFAKLSIAAAPSNELYTIYATNSSASAWGAIVGSCADAVCCHWQ